MALNTIETWPEQFLMLRRRAEQNNLTKARNEGARRLRCVCRSYDLRWQRAMSFAGGVLPPVQAASAGTFMRRVSRRKVFSMSMQETQAVPRPRRIFRVTSPFTATTMFDAWLADDRFVRRSDAPTLLRLLAKNCSWVARGLDLRPCRPTCEAIRNRKEVTS